MYKINKRCITITHKYWIRLRDDTHFYYFFFEPQWSGYPARPKWFKPTFLQSFFIAWKWSKRYKKLIKKNSVEFKFENIICIFRNFNAFSCVSWGSGQFLYHRQKSFIFLVVKWLFPPLSGPTTQKTLFYLCLPLVME